MTEVNLRELDREALTDHETAYLQSLGKDFWRLLWPAVGELATGKAVEPERLAALANLPLDRTLAIARETGWEWDPGGEQLVGAGLTAIKTRHRVEMGGRTMWVWCAPDALELPVMLGKPVRTQSSCPDTGDPIRVHATPTGVESVDPPSAVLSLADAPFGDLANVRQTACNQQNFYRDAAAASGWLAANPHGAVLPVVDAFDVTRAAFLRIKEWIDQPTD